MGAELSNPPRHVLAHDIIELVRENPRRAASLLLWALTGFVLVYGVLLFVQALRLIVAIVERSPLA